MFDEPISGCLLHTSPVEMENQRKLKVHIFCHVKCMFGKKKKIFVFVLDVKKKNLAMLKVIY